MIVAFRRTRNKSNTPSILGGEVERRRLTGYLGYRKILLLGLAFIVRLQQERSSEPGQKRPDWSAEVFTVAIN